MQQGGPLGSLLFSLTINEALSSISCAFVAGYLDDITLGGPMDSVTKEIFNFQSRSKELGLNLNYNKCEVIGLSSTTTERWNETPYKFIHVNRQIATLLGTPIGRRC